MAFGTDPKKIENKLTMKDVNTWLRLRINTLNVERQSMEYCASERHVQVDKNRVNIINAKIEALNELFYLKKPKK